MENINRGKKRGYKAGLSNLFAANAARAAAKIARLSQDVIPCAPETTVQLEPKLFCATYSSKEIIDTN